MKNDIYKLISATNKLLKVIDKIEDLKITSEEKKELSKHLGNIAIQSEIAKEQLTDENNALC